MIDMVFDVHDGVKSFRMRYIPCKGRLERAEGINRVVMHQKFPNFAHYLFHRNGEVQTFKVNTLLTDLDN